jgi:hypothetical protein
VNAEEIIARLKKSFNAPSKKDERLKVVLICIVISTTFWFFSALNQDNYTSQIDYPIDWEFDQEDFMAVGELPEKVPIEVVGGGWDLMTRSFGFNMRPVTIQLDQPNSSGYIMTSQLRLELIRNLEPVSLSFLIQDSLRYNVQPIRKRTLALGVDQTSLDFDAAYRLSTLQITPDSIEVFGPEELVNQMPDSFKLNVDLKGIDRDLIEDVSIPELPEYIESTLSSTVVSIEVLAYLSVSEKVTIELVNFPRQELTISPTEVVVEYQISETAFDATDSSRVTLLADYKKWNPQDSTIQLDIVRHKEMIENMQLSTEYIKVYQP